VFFTEPTIPKYTDLTFLNNYFKSPNLSDITFIVQHEKFYAHRIILCSQSVVFKQMLDNPQWKDSSQKELTITEITSATFSKLLQFYYSGDITLRENDLNSALELLLAADRFLNDRLTKICASQLYKQLSVENAFAIFTQADTTTNIDLRKTVSNFILNNYITLAFADPEYIMLLKVLDNT